MKKILCVALAFVILVLGSIPAAAYEVGFSDPWIDILQFGGIVGQDSLKIACNKGQHSLAEVQNDGVSVGWIELVFSAPNGISGLVVTDRRYPSLDKWWTVKQLSSDMYVAYCEYSSRSPDTFQFDFYYTGGASYTLISLLSVRALSPYSNPGKLDGNLSVTLGNSTPIYSTFTSGGTATIERTGTFTHASTSVYFTREQWSGWSYIDLALQIQNVSSIISIQASCAGVIIPIEYNLATMEGTQGNGTSGGDVLPYWVARFHLDLTGLQASGTVTLSVTWKPTGTHFGVSTWSATGTVDVNSVPLLSRWFKRLQVWFIQLGNTITDGFDRVVNAISPTSSSDLLPDSEQHKNEMQENQNVINSVTQPSFNDSSFDISGLTGSDNSIGVILATPLTESSYIFNVFLMIFTLALGSYILFGKR